MHEGARADVVTSASPGLDPAKAEGLIEVFYTTKPDSLGMGLSICRSIVEAHGGRLSATANEPHGAVFQFVLPHDRQSPDPTARGMA